MIPKYPQVYLGFDPRGAAAYETARSSIWRRTEGSLNIYPLRLPHLPMLTRPIEKRGNQLWCPISNAPMSTEFAISRFTVPFLQPTGWALFADCDILCWSDIADLFALADDKYAVMVVKHEHEGGERVLKMDGQVQTFYNRKNWSSVVLWNCSHEANKRFTLEHLNTWPGRDLHSFKWLADEEIGALPHHWNWLINVNAGLPEKKGIWHYTLGGPWFPDWQPKPYDDIWIEEAKLRKLS